VAEEILAAAAEGRDVDWGDAEGLARAWLAATASTLAFRVLAEGPHAGTALVELCARIVELVQPERASVVGQGGEA